MEKKVNTEELKLKKPEPFKKACIYTNIAYALVEVADSFLVDANFILKGMGANIDKAEKAKFKRTLQYGNFFRANVHDITKQIYALDISNEALDDADKLYDIINLIMDRCGGDMNILSRIRATIFNSFKSIYGIYESH